MHLILLKLKIISKMFAAFPVVQDKPELSLVAEKPFSMDTAQFDCSFKSVETSDPAKVVEYRVEWFVGGVSLLNDSLADGSNSSLLRVDSLSSEDIRKSVRFCILNEIKCIL